MNQELVIIVVAILLLFILYFVLAKGEKKKITLINADGKKITVEVEMADSTVTRAKGLMGRKSLGEYEGMLFVFDRPGKYGFWMVNTSIPLDAIHFSESGTAVDILVMEPNSTKVIHAKEDAKYVLEVNKGFSKRNNIKIGKSRIEDA